ncbi:uncharacterized protein LOC104415434 [Eucalyptus grandis]|uniref:Uncharacterized protein n=2 Tax=Eucalyptus grandis TaxID=71139 RepID=A0ACC3JWB0_EUCGR|nr:uncharacterized protein LOC104415434 [Eucalyptus grandis]KAK3418383.1 hypothetical protein EUGRSUZ_H04340 [Eucalyptus grandis]
MSSGGGVAVVDGAQLGDVDLSLPDHLAAAPLTGAQVIELAESRVSDRLYGIALPETIRSTALGRVGGGFQGAELDGDQAAEKLREYVAAIADALKDDPIVVSILDGSTIQIYLEDEDDFAMLAENLFTELDAQDTGKIKKSEIRRALDHMGVDMGVPPPSELPLLSDILKKHGAEGEEEVGQAQFAEVLQSVLHEVADTLAEKRIVFTHNAKVVNGSKIRKLLSNEKQLMNVTEKILEGNHEKDCVETVRKYLEKNGADMGLPPPDVEEAVALYNAVFYSAAYDKSVLEWRKDEIREIVKDILEKFAEQLETDPVCVDLGN